MSFLCNQIIHLHICKIDNLLDFCFFSTFQVIDSALLKATMSMSMVENAVQNKHLRSENVPNRQLQVHPDNHVYLLDVLEFKKMRKGLLQKKKPVTV